MGLARQSKEVRYRGEYYMTIVTAAGWKKRRRGEQVHLSTNLPRANVALAAARICTYSCACDDRVRHRRRYLRLPQGNYLWLMAPHHDAP